LAGCGAFSTQQTASSVGAGSSPTIPGTGAAATPGPTFKGNVHGGQQPVVGSHIYLFAANPGGYRSFVLAG
jgi:hypothetical protein